jgi:hypothetical protein
VNDRLEEIRELTDDLLWGAASGCCLHILVDDFNIEDRHVDFCIYYAEQNGCDECRELAELYRELTKRERALVLDMKWCPECESYEPYSICGRCKTELEQI